MDRFDLSNISETYHSMYNNMNEGVNLFKKRGSKITQKEFEKILEMFLIFAKRELKLKQIPEINFSYSSSFAAKRSAFGIITNRNVITVEALDRHPMDILRTVAHELVHYSQHARNVHGNGKAGSVTEDEANMKAGELLRNFGGKHSYLFKLGGLR